MFAADAPSASFAVIAPSAIFAVAAPFASFAIIAPYARTAIVAPNEEFTTVAPDAPDGFLRNCNYRRALVLRALAWEAEADKEDDSALKIQT